MDQLSDKDIKRLYHSLIKVDERSIPSFEETWENIAQKNQISNRKSITWILKIAAAVILMLIPVYFLLKNQKVSDPPEFNDRIILTDALITGDYYTQFIWDWTPPTQSLLEGSFNQEYIIETFKQ